MSERSQVKILFGWALGLGFAVLVLLTVMATIRNAEDGVDNSRFDYTEICNRARERYPNACQEAPTNGR